MPQRVEKVEGYPSLELLSKQVVEGFITGLHKSPFHGFSVEFAEHRLYNIGEETKNIDWKLYARCDKLFVKKYEEETNLRCMLVLDSSSSMYYPLVKNVSFSNPNKIAFSIFATASLIQMLYKQRDAFGISSLTDHIELSSDIKSSFAHKRYVFSLLEQMLHDGTVEDKKLTSLSSSLHLLAQSVHKRSLIVIFTDLFSSSFESEDFISSLEHLKHQHHEVILFWVNDRKEEINFEFKNRPYRFIDIETNEQVKVNALAVRNAYKEKTTEKINSIKSLCGKIGIEFVEADIAKDFNQILLPFILKRAKMN